MQHGIDTQVGISGVELVACPHLLCPDCDLNPLTDMMNPRIMWEWFHTVPHGTSGIIPPDFQLFQSFLLFWGLPPSCLWLPHVCRCNARVPSLVSPVFHMIMTVQTTGAHNQSKNYYTFAVQGLGVHLNHLLDVVCPFLLVLTSYPPIHEHTICTAGAI